MLSNNKSGLLVAVLIAAFTGTTAFASDVFVANVAKCGATGTPSGCGSNGAATDPLKQGSVRVDDAGNVAVQLTGAKPATKYVVFVGNWVKRDRWQDQFNGEGPFCSGSTAAVGSITTDKLGNFKGPITTAKGKTFVFPAKTAIGQPSFAFNPESTVCTVTQFTSGFVIR